ncbi:MAG: DUF58 domain-containing protein [candidate division Zixibacteria bacterium]|nr:DUF58 domain-containing protein [candidate division Zixibacteria bacterium]
MPKPSTSKYLTPEVLSRLKSLEIKARLVVEGFIAGLHRSPYHGFSVEFAEYRQYMPGDSIRHVDWKVYAKSDRFYIKEFEVKTNLKGYLLVDCSRSMAFAAEDRIDKLTYSLQLAAALSFLMLKQRDAVGLVGFAEKINSYIPPRSAVSHLHVLLREMDKYQASAQTNIADTLHQMAERIRRRGLIILISDLLDDPTEIMAGLKHFRHNKHELIIFHVLDPRERDFSFPLEAIFKDMETGEQINTLPWQIKGDYQEVVAEVIDRFSRECRMSRIDYVPIDTAMPYDYALFAYLNKRSRLY